MSDAGRRWQDKVEALRGKSKGGTLGEALQESQDLAWAVLYRGDATWHAGPGWYYVDEEYPDEGSCGAFETAEEAIKHAEASDYRIRAWAC